MTLHRGKPSTVIITAQDRDQKKEDFTTVLFLCPDRAITLLWGRVIVDYGGTVKT